MSQDRRPAGRARGRTARALAAFLLAFGLVGLVAGCGFDAQTLKPYTPADGTNLDVGSDNELKIRNLVVISRVEGQGIVSASVVSGTGDRLTGVTVTPSPLAASPGQPATASLTQPVEIPQGVNVVLTNGSLVTVQSPGIKAGEAAKVTMTFAQAGEVSLDCPVVDGTLEPWNTISAAPSPSVSPTPGSTP